jgi:tetratricopeptide (TPR) repeat protein
MAVVSAAWRGGQAPAPAPPPQAVTLLAAAERAFARGQLDDVDKLVKGRPSGDPDAAAIRGRLAVLLGKYADAEQLLAQPAAESPRSEAALQLGLLLQMVGRKPEAAAILTRIAGGASAAREAADLARAARAARALGLVREANGYFREAVVLAPKDPAINTAWGELFLEKYNRQDAARSFRAALAADPEWVPAHVGLAHTLVDENPADAAGALAKALAIAPSSIPAHLLKAQLALDEGRREDARGALAKAIEINPHDLETRALLASVAYLEGRQPDFEAEAARALAINPTYGDLYRIAGDQAARSYRFDEAVTLVRRALEIEPDNTRAYAELGIHLLRTGDEEAARAALDRAFKADPFDVITYNLLGMFDTLAGFQTLTEGSITMRLHPEEADILREYAVPLAHEALATLSKRYDFTPKGPILIEVFPKHDDFAVRNVGLPGMIGALGACFGRVITMDSPRARPPGTFSWAATLWHEMAHVITLQMSAQRVPRWLSEGVSVFEEKRARPEWGRDMELTFVHALDRGRLLKLRDLNTGFSNPELIGLTYYQASLLVEHMVAAHGEPALHRLLRAYGEGLETDAALEKALSIDVDRLQKAFDAFLEERFGALRKILRIPQGLEAATGVDALRTLAAANPDSYPVQLSLGRALADAQDVDGAVAALERASALVPTATGKESPRAIIAELAAARGDRPRAMQELETLLAHDHTNIDASRTLAALAEEAADRRRQRLALERVVDLDPMDAAVHATLGRLALDAGDATVAMREFRAALAAGPVDRAAAHCDLAESYLRAGRTADAKKQALAALEIAPTFERAQELLLKTVEVQP